MIKRTQVYLEEAHLKQLKYIALDKNISFTELVRQITKGYLEKFKDKKNIILP